MIRNQQRNYMRYVLPFSDIQIWNKTDDEETARVNQDESGTKTQSSRMKNVTNWHIERLAHNWTSYRYIYKYM